MNSLELTTRSPEQTQEFGTRLGELANPGDVILLVGKLGAGKTCLTQGIAWGLGIKEYAASPSFVLVRELKGRLPLYHLDFYRLENLAEIAELGLDEYFYGQGVSVVEWAEKALSLLPPENLLIEMEYIAETGRRLELKPSGKRYREMVARLK
ncbi:MAG: tRNA (adenosine(37)-N6)-threonylcarbamoyltransferase complex ATPase subunit type 1 TsaE [Dehalococcoidales bacterium]|nr:tRNA (adenosine(37)-N6)-threonylcarbamoyltransferase complex ATPase subunit type 1 TsaE [Dehalococcoidales bacterium]